MRYSISNIAWDQSEESIVFPFLRSIGITGIEVAPTKIWSDWRGLDEGAARAYARKLCSEGFMTPSIQAIFFGTRFGSIFESSNHAPILNHLSLVADLAAEMVAPTVIFGSPNMRRLGYPAPRNARLQVLALLRAAARIFHHNGVTLCLEACAKSYDCDFVNTHTELLALISEIDEPGFGLHIDSGNLYETDEHLTDILGAGVPIQHFHLSEPGLQGFEPAVAPHTDNLALLRQAKYPNWVSIEMRRTEQPLQQSGPWKFLLGGLE